MNIRADIEKRLEELKEYFEAERDVDAVYLFGSYALIVSKRLAKLQRIGDTW